MRKANFCYEQRKNKKEGIPNWKSKRTSNFEQRMKGFKPNKNFKNNSRNFSKNNYQGTNFKGKTQQNFIAPKSRDMPSNYVKNNEQREPIKYQECHRPHYAKDCPNKKKNFNNVHIIQEEATVGDVANQIPRIHAALENQQGDYQTSMLEIKDMIHNKPISVLIDPGASLSYVSPSIAERCNLRLKNIGWFNQLHEPKKRQLAMSKIVKCLSQFKTQVKLNVLPLGSYDVLIGMEWLEKHKVVLNYRSWSI